MVFFFDMLLLPTHDRWNNFFHDEALNVLKFVSQCVCVCVCFSCLVTKGLDKLRKLFQVNSAVSRIINRLEKLPHLSHVP